MRKVISVLCVLALLVVPAFAANQTPGEAAQDQATETLQNPTVENGKDLAGKINADKDIVVNQHMTDALKAVLTNNVGQGVADNTQEVGGMSVRTLTSETASALTVSSVKLEGQTLKLDASFASNQSDLGTYVEIEIPDASGWDMNKEYMWECGGQTGAVRMIWFADGGTGKSCKVCFYAPHFSTYTISAVGSTVVPDQKPAPEQNPASGSVLAETGADMNIAFVAVAALCAAMVIGCAIVLKKKPSQQ